VAAVAAVASPAPFDAPGLDYFAGMGERNADDIRLIVSDPAAARVKWDRDREELLQAGAEDVTQILLSVLSAVDRAALTERFVEWLVASWREGLAPSATGWWDESRSLRAPWGFNLDEIKIPVQIWHGDQDRFVPIEHGRWLASRVPGAIARLRSDDGHLTLLERRSAEWHAWLRERLPM
jgi:pimeloyl-ACP methyl ester carboxylesterase